MPELKQVLPEDSQVNSQGHLEIGGCDLLEVAREYGTPAYVYAEADIEARARQYLEAFKREDVDFEIAFASKALSCKAVYQLLSHQGLAVDVASGGELYMALGGGTKPEKVFFHGNNKSSQEIKQALEVGVGYLVIDSFDEIELLNKLVEKPQKVLLRVNPDVTPETHSSIQTGQKASKFGFALDNGSAQEAIEKIKSSPNLDLKGLHAHIGSQILDLEVFQAEIKALSTIFDASMSVLNLGGGLGISYTASQPSPPSVESLVSVLVAQVKKHFDPLPQIVLEPGRSLVGRAGVTVYEVGVCKDIPGVANYVAVNGGMSDNLRPMLYQADYQALLAERPNATPDKEVALVGKHCESGDNLIAKTMLPSPAVGDILVVAATGAYGHSMANNYNGLLRPPIVFCKNGVAREVVRRETYQDLIARES